MGDRGRQHRLASPRARDDRGEGKEAWRAFGYPLRSFSLRHLGRGEVSIPDVGDVSVVSLYGLTDEKTDASVHRSLSDLEPIFEDRDFNRLLLLGGDLNIFANPRPDDPARHRHVLVLERIKGYGLVDLLERDLDKRDPPRGGLSGCPCRKTDCKHVWTFRSTNKSLTKIPYQDDHVFASPALTDRLKSCETAGFNDASDHAPILATFWV